MRLFLGLLMLLSTNLLTAQQRTPRNYELQGHRGCRGLMPENTIPAFLKALNLGVNTLELDVVVSQDGQVVVSHEPYFNAEFTTKPDGTPVTKDEQKWLVLYRMPYADIKQYDVGRRGNARFPEQQKQPAIKPLLRDVIAAVEAHRVNGNVPRFGYNIELKSEGDEYDKSQPQPAEFCRLVNQILTEANLDPNRVVIQSFDFAVLQQWQQQMTAKKLLPVRLSALVENIRGIDHNLEKLGFKPAIYSPNYQLISRDGIEKLHQLGVKVIPWTVNNPKDMRRLLDLGVDGLITDYPDRAIEL
ncbi:glycerophosphoryl diester phosphodiesterase [Fibrella aestuarina BUZ 2]|uniref:Glycerophosphoryl diester phosphodiesterase n=1 Tax=Fibrella aestuarina BUZ 2 TaxID=1166018 RepID=I0K2Y5_9BACT|nr:glycerophosphodiester phosphodiesterase family protein [Fibrella aestuarina]CCG98488.1 glycerophosphoryl diester phosphodiesterase [Fibrella aestuarina BUZ 2]